MKKAAILLITLLMASLTSFSQPNCMVLEIEGINTGYCTEGLDGKGKCVKIKITDASRCFDDEQTSISN